MVYHLEVFYQSCADYVPEVKVRLGLAVTFYKEKDRKNFRHLLLLNPEAQSSKVLLKALSSGPLLIQKSVSGVKIYLGPGVSCVYRHIYRENFKNLFV